MSESSTTPQRTYCNPIPLPDYPRGRASREKKTYGGGWLNNGRRLDFRETADPSVLYHDGKWYLYPSCGMAWVSEDFCTWQHVSMNIDDVGYAPTILAYRDAFYLTASAKEESVLYRADSPLGPWEMMGRIQDRHGEPLPHFWDPMYFADDDGRVYLYWGCGGPGIFGVEVDPTAPYRALTDPQLLFSYNPEHAWERFGRFNEDPSESWVEGAWMFKHDGLYYLTYCAPGTCLPTYAMGVYTAKSPLGPFTYASRNPFLRDTQGLVSGPGHGCIVCGPNDTVWAFYTCIVCYHHIFERRIGFDPVGFDEEGNIFVAGASEWPQWAPGVNADPHFDNDTGWLPLTIGKYPTASSEAPGRVCSYAIDNVMRTWWEPESDDAEPWLAVNLRSAFTVYALRVVWAEPGLDYDNGALPGPFKYRVDVKERADGDWKQLLDCTENETDLLIDYRTVAPTEVVMARLTITGWPAGLRPGVIDFQLFGTGHNPPPGKYGHWPMP